MFSIEVCKQLKYYVYRLIDPRNGETFYVGKGTGNRVFSHVRDELGSDADVLSDKLQRIREIRRANLEVMHIIHRHGMDEKTAFEVEAALIDAYPAATNVTSGIESASRGIMHAEQIIEKFEAKEADFLHKAILININRSAIERVSYYEAVRYAWKINPRKAARADIVLAVQQGLIVGVFVADKWIEATPENFPGTVSEASGRWGFVGHEADKDIEELYLFKRVPRKRGEANPIKYTFC